jgi:Sulfotransferase family
MTPPTDSAGRTSSGKAFDGRPPIFVGGLPRSGTTLVARLLGSHSEIALPPAELGFFNVLWKPGDRPDRPMRDRAEFEQRLQRLLRRIPAWGLPEQELLDASRTVKPTFQDLFVFLLDFYRRSVDKPRAAEKSVYYHQWLYVLDTWFEDYRFVHVVRHPVDSFASVKWFKRGTPRPNKVDLIPWMHEWNESATLALHRAHARFDRYCLVRYEDVVARPADVLERACQVIGVTAEPERMLSLAAGEATESSFVDEHSVPEHEGRIRRSDSIERSERIDRHEREAIEAVCASLAHLLGYDLGPPRRRRGSVGQPVARSVPATVALPFAIARARERLGKLVGRGGSQP